MGGRSGIMGSSGKVPTIKSALAWSRKVALQADLGEVGFDLAPGAIEKAPPEKEHRVGQG